MKKICILLISLLFVLHASAAMATEMIAPHPMGYTYYEKGQNQYYSVVFDEEGEAYVVGKVTLFNVRHDIDHLDMVIPGKGLRVINVMQEIHYTEKACSWYDNYPAIDIQVDYEDVDVDINEECKEWYDRQITKWGVIEPTLLQDTSLAGASTKVTIPLKENVTREGTTTILFSYKINGYVDAGWHTYDFDFQTPQFDYDFSEVRVAVNVQPDLVLKGEASEINYQPNYAVMESAPLSVLDETASTRVNSLSHQIEYQRGFVKQAYGLDPGENMVVSGMYGDSTFWLYSGRIVTTLVGILLFMGFVIAALIKAGMSKRKKYGLVFASSLGGASAIVGSWIFLVLLAHMDLFAYPLDGFIWLLIILCEVILMGGILVGGPLYVGSKQGFQKGALTFGATMGWLFVFLAGFAVVLMLISSGQNTELVRVLF